MKKLRISPQFALMKDSKSFRKACGKTFNQESHRRIVNNGSPESEMSYRNRKYHEKHPVRSKAKKSTK